MEISSALRASFFASISAFFVDTRGNLVIEANYAYEFSEDLAAVKIGDVNNGKWGFINKKGKIIIEAQFTHALSFSEGVAAVMTGDERNGK